jgi:hypothetical protein
MSVQAVSGSKRKTGQRNECLGHSLCGSWSRTLLRWLCSSYYMSHNRVTSSGRGKNMVLSCPSTSGVGFQLRMRQVGKSEG